MSRNNIEYEFNLKDSKDWKICLNRLVSALSGILVGYNNCYDMELFKQNLEKFNNNQQLSIKIQFIRNLLILFKDCFLYTYSKANLKLKIEIIDYPETELGESFIDLFNNVVYGLKFVELKAERKEKFNRDSYIKLCDSFWS